MQYARSIVPVWRPVGVLAVLTILSACSTGTESVNTTTGDVESYCCAEEAGVALLEMRGNEPFWNAALYSDQLHLSGLNRELRRFAVAEHNVVGSADSVSVSHYRLIAEGETQVSAQLQVKPELCRDSMSGMPYPNTVAFSETNGEQLRGCAGNPEDLLIGSEWRITSVAGAPVPADVMATIEFSDSGAMYGTSGCNRFSGSFELTGENLLFSQIASTKMACAGTQMRIEESVLAGFGEVVQFDFSSEGNLQLMLQSGGVIEAVR